MSNLSFEPEFLAAQNRSFLSFRVGDQNFALPVERVRQVTYMVQITPLPQFRPQVEGMIMVRGEMVLVSDMRCLLHTPVTRTGLYTPIVLVVIQSRLVGLIVDEVYDVFERPLEQLIPPETLLPDGVEVSPVFTGVVESPDGMNLLVAPDHLFQPGQIEVIVQAARSLKTDARFSYFPTPQAQPQLAPVQERSGEELRRALEEKFRELAGHAASNDLAIPDGQAVPGPDSGPESGPDPDAPSTSKTAG